MKTVNIKDVEEKFNDLICEKISREEVSNWALDMQDAEDECSLEYFPKNKEDAIWEGISYLTGVDLPDLNRKYLHCKEDFIREKNKIFSNSD